MKTRSTMKSIDLKKTPEATGVFQEGPIDETNFSTTSKDKHHSSDRIPISKGSVKIRKTRKDRTT